MGEPQGEAQVPMASQRMEYGRPGFCSRAPLCRICGKHQGYIFGLEGFGMRDKGHERRCAARVHSLRNVMRDLPANRSSSQKDGTALPVAEGESLQWLNALFCE